MISPFFADAVKAKARQISTMTSIIILNPCGDRKTMQASSEYSMPHTARRTWFIVGSGPIDVGVSFRCTSSAKMTVCLLNLCRTMVSTAATKMLNNSGNSTYSCQVLASPRASPNRRRHQAAHKLSSHRGSVR